MVRTFDTQGSRTSGSSQPMQSRMQSRQSTSNGFMGTAREHPVATAAAVGGAVAAGAFLWSRRNQISDQVSNMSGQISDWSENMRSQQGQSSKQSRTSSSSRGDARSSIPIGTELPAQPEMAGAGSSSPASSTRATGGLGGKAQSGQNLNPSREPSEGASY